MNLNNDISSGTSISSKGFIPQHDRIVLSPPTSGDVKNSGEQNIFSPNKSPHEMMQAIVDDDVLFQELKRRMRESGIVTNKGIAVALQCSILESMLPKVHHQDSSVQSTNTKTQSIFWPWFKAKEELQKAKVFFQFKKNQMNAATMTSDSEKGCTLRYSDVLRNSRFDHKVVASSRNRSLCLNGIPLINFNENLHDIKYTNVKNAPKGNKLLFNTLILKPLTAPTRSNRSFSINNSPYCARTREILNEKLLPVKAVTAEKRIERRSSLWTEETVQDLYDETISRGKRSFCSRKKTQEELLEIEEGSNLKFSDCVLYGCNASSRKNKKAFAA